MKAFRSNKNRFEIYPESKQIWKFFQNQQDYIKELEIYKKSPAFAPKLSGFFPQQNMLKLQLLKAKTLLEIKPDFAKIAQLFYQLHQLEPQTICLCDTNPKNILYDTELKRYFLIDFSDWQYLPKETDLITFLLFWASIYSEADFVKAAINFLSEYNKHSAIDWNNWQQILPRASAAFDERRARFNHRKAITAAEPLKNREFMQKIENSLS